MLMDDSVVEEDERGKFRGNVIELFFTASLPYSFPGFVFVNH